MSNSFETPESGERMRTGEGERTGEWGKGKEKDQLEMIRTKGETQERRKERRDPGGPGASGREKAGK